jgi:hypothetical protein
MTAFLYGKWWLEMIFSHGVGSGVAMMMVRGGTMGLILACFMKFV